MKTMKLSKAELSWIYYCLRYVYECYEDDIEANTIVPKRVKELKMSLKLMKKLETP